MKELLQYSDEVAEAKAAGKPIVSLESTIIAHGMPWPQNFETALELESMVRQHGAVPATIAIDQGRLKVGLVERDLEDLARKGSEGDETGEQNKGDKVDKGDKVEKCSTRDMAVYLAQKRTAATTVSATMFISHLAGIKVFATGGIGGVHRNWNQHWDVSADLEELARSEVLVISAGAKSILDLEATLEFLESRGVPVMGWQCDEFPAFYSASSGLPIPHRLDDLQELARTVNLQLNSGLGRGMLLAVPVPLEHEANMEEMELATQKALDEASKAGVSGKKLTPFLLEKIRSISDGDSLRANVQLALNNARLGAQLAVAMSDVG